MLRTCLEKKRSMMMFHQYRSIAGRMMGKAKRTIASSTTVSQFLLSSRSAVAPFSSCPQNRSIVTMNKDENSRRLDAIFEQKRSLRDKLRRVLKNMDPVQKSVEDNAIQNSVLEAPWFRSSKSVCAYISCDALREVDTSRILTEILCDPCKAQEGNSQTKKKLYVPRVEDRNSNMRMLKISALDDLVSSSMNLLEPKLVDCHGAQHEDVMQASDPVDLFILPGNSYHQFCCSHTARPYVGTTERIISFPDITLFFLRGLAFDRAGRRLGRSGGYYDTFLKKYIDLVKDRKWKQPLLVALSYSPQIIEDGVIPVTAIDIPVDALVSPSGFVPISPSSLERSNLTE